MLEESQHEQDQLNEQMLIEFFQPNDDSITLMTSMVHGHATQAPTQKIPEDLQLALFHHMLGTKMVQDFSISNNASGEVKYKWLLRSFKLHVNLSRLPVIRKTLTLWGQKVLKAQATEGLIKLGNNSH